MPIRVQVVGHGVVEFPDGTSQDDMQKALASLQAGDTAAAKPAPQTAEGNSFGDKVLDAAKKIGVALPAAGATVGSFVGSVPGAIIGGAAGQGYKELAQHAAELPGAVVDVARNLVAHPVETAQGLVGGGNRGAVDMGTQGAVQGVADAAGGAIVNAAVTPMSKWLMNRATTRVSAKLMQDFPELSDTLIDNALTVSQGGYGRARALLMTAKGKATAALKAADDAGSTLPIQMNGDLAESLKTALLEKLVKSGKVPAPQAGQALDVASARLDAPTKALFAEIDAAAANGSALDLVPSQADLLKTQLQKESRALYANRAAPNGQKAMGMDATERAEFATQLNTAIDGLASGYKAANAEAKPLIGAVRGIQQAIRPNGNLYQAMIRPAVGMATGGAIGQREGGTPGSIVGGIVGAAATSPAGMSREAIVLAHPAMQQILTMLPRGLGQWLVSSLATGQQESPAGTPGGSP